MTHIVEARLSPLDCSIITEEMELVLVADTDGGGWPSTNPEWVRRTYTVTSKYDLNTLPKHQLKQLAEWLNCDNWAVAELQLINDVWTLNVMDF